MDSATCTALSRLSRQDSSIPPAPELEKLLPLHSKNVVPNAQQLGQLPQQLQNTPVRLPVCGCGGGGGVAAEGHTIVHILSDPSNLLA